MKIEHAYPVKEHKNVNDRIDHCQEMINTFNEDLEIELNYFNEFYQIKLRKILNKIEQLENEEVLLKIRV